MNPYVQRKMPTPPPKTTWRVAPPLAEKQRDSHLFFPLQIEAEKGAIEVNKPTIAEKAKIGH